jgi:radical SAM protein with 4Fe4S-binding SPASM domain
MKLKEIIKNAKWRKDWYLGKLKPSPPFFINIEPTNICNLHCTICSMDGSRKPGYMDMDLFKKIIKEASESGISEVRLFLGGEPLLNKQIQAMIKLSKSCNLVTTIHTNATMLTKELGEKLINTGLDLLSISFHGDNKEIYEKIMQGANFDSVLENVISFLNLKKKKNRGLNGKPEVVIQIVKGSVNEPLVISNDFKRKFKNLPVDKFIILHPHNWAGEIDLDSKAKRHNRYFHCQHLYQSMSIAYNGDVFACCGDLNGRMIIENANNSPLKDIWHSEKFCSMREKLKKGEYKGYPLCSSCDVLWRERHPFFTDIASLMKLSYMKNKILEIIK